MSGSAILSVALCTAILVLYVAANDAAANVLTATHDDVVAHDAAAHVPTTTDDVATDVSAAASDDATTYDAAATNDAATADVPAAASDDAIAYAVTTTIGSNASFHAVRSSSLSTTNGTTAKIPVTSN